MKVTNRLKLMLKSMLSVRFGMIKTDKAVLNWDGEDELKEGDEVYIFDEQGEALPAEDGDYISDDGKTISVLGGKVSAIVDPAAEVAAEGEEETPAEETAPKADPALVLDGLIKVIEALGTKVETLEAKVAELEAKVAEIKGEPVGEPAENDSKNEEPLEQGTALARMRFLRRR